MILLNFGWMVDLAMNIFEFLTKFLIFWHPWHPWVCVRSDLKQIWAIPPTVPRVPMASLWPNGGNKANWRKIWAKNIFFFKKILYVIPSALLSFLPYYCHSFRIIVIPSILLSFLPNIVIPSKLFRELQILTSSKSFPYPKGEKNGHQRWP